MNVDWILGDRPRWLGIRLRCAHRGTVSPELTNIADGTQCNDAAILLGVG